jgi:hypothetical protein
MDRVDSDKGTSTTLEAPYDDVPPVPLGAIRTHYVPSTETEKRLDKSVNLKMDLLVISVLAIDFLLQGVDKTNVGFAAASSRMYLTSKESMSGFDKEQGL